jgi:hypothetical protein
MWAAGRASLLASALQQHYLDPLRSAKRRADVELSGSLGAPASLDAEKATRVGWGDIPG